MEVDILLKICKSPKMSSQSKENHSVTTNTSESISTMSYTVAMLYSIWFQVAVRQVLDQKVYWDGPVCPSFPPSPKSILKLLKRAALLKPIQARPNRSC